MNRGLKWKLIAGFALVFVAGGITGAFIGASHARHFFFEPHPKLLSERMRHHLRAQLGLSKEQVAKISPIVDKAAAELGEIQRSTGQRVHETIAQEHSEIAVYLTDEQRAKLQELDSRSRHWQGFRGLRRSPPQKREL
jgi:Spy/CpxP family protein refolding chaperone